MAARCSVAWVPVLVLLLVVRRAPLPMPALRLPLLAPRALRRVPVRELRLVVSVPLVARRLVALSVALLVALSTTQDR